MAKIRKHKTQIHDIRKKRKLTSYRAAAWLWIRIILASLVCIFVFTPAMSGIKQEICDYFYDISNSSGFSVKKIIVTGQKNSDIEEVIKISAIEKNKSIFLPDLYAAREKLQAHRWVREAAISRILPNKIVLHIREHAPVAIWQNKGKLHLINEKGDVIVEFTDHRKIDKKFLKLIHVIGPGAAENAALFERSLSGNKEIRQKISSATRIENRRWDIRFRSGVVVKMPEKSFKSALKYLAKLNKSGRLDNDKKNKFIDLRNSKKFYIKKQ